MPRFFTFLPLLIALTPVLLQGAEPLRWKFAKGDTNFYRMTQKSVSTFVTPAGEVKSETSQHIDMAWIVDSVDEKGVATLRQDIVRVVMKIASPAMPEVTFDTNLDDPPQGIAATIAPVFDAMVKHDIQMNITPLGKVVEVTPPEELMKAMKGLPGVNAAKNMDQMFRQIARGSFFLLPEGPLEVGKGSTNKFDLPMPMIGKQVVETSQKYVGPREVDGRQMEVFKPSLTIKKKESDEPAKIDVEFDVKETKGEVLFDRKAGKIASSKMTQLMEMKILVNGTEINGSMEQTATLAEITADQAGKDAE